MKRPAKRYVSLVAVGVQEQAEDILVPPLLRNCLTLMTFTFVIIISPPQNSGHCNSFYCLGHSKNVYDNDDDHDRKLGLPVSRRRIWNSNAGNFVVVTTEREEHTEAHQRNSIEHQCKLNCS